MRLRLKSTVLNVRFVPAKLSHDHSELFKFIFELLHCGATFILSGFYLIVNFACG